MEHRRRLLRVFNNIAQRVGAIKKVEINWDVSQNVTQMVEDMYSSRIFGEEKIIDWDGK